MTEARRLPHLRWLATALVLAAVPAHAALHIAVDGSVQDAAERQLSQRLIENVLARVPEAIIARVDLQLRLRWREDLPHDVQGRARGDVLGLDRRLLASLLDHGQDDDASRLAWHQASAALIHELGHALDRSAAGGWSRQARFLDLAGWQQRPLWPGRGRNHFSQRSPDRYELKSPAEFFAVNLEHYLLDADYRCRRPGLHTWFAEELGMPRSLPAVACAPALPFVRAGEQEGVATLQELDPARVYEVDYLLAEGNEQLMSRWGHSMLRLVVCAPGRPPGPACRMDLQHHLVLSFRAFVGDVQISSLRGLTGSYPSRLFVLPLRQVVEEYTKVELRGLSSTPLRLRPEEINALLQQAARLHWEYDGRYYFISNNCAVEAWKLLHDGVPALAAQPLASITPTGLLARLQGRALVKDSPAERGDAVRMGYYFESAAAHYAQVFAVAREALPLPANRVEQWLRLPAAERRRWMEQADGRVLAALLLLEQAAWRRDELAARDVLKRRLLRASDESPESAKFQALMARGGALLAPGSLVESGYGLPSADEREQLARVVAAGTAEAIDEWRQLRQMALEALPAEQRAEMERIESNLDYLRHQLQIRYGTQSGEAVVPVEGLPDRLSGERV